uniref:BTB domain-containing protein n=1 Tax=Mycena chlorophos TaxID=658473 RepID=A0ABQ0LEB6_MYCCL|nr:predicted protein [Mycena chlorophos]
MIANSFLSFTVIMDVDPPLTELHRIEELWFDDGNIVLQAGYAQYKVFRGILARHSVVFQDMFAFPQPPDEESVDGCPLVHLPDAEVEVTPFLKALFEPNYFPPFPMKTKLVTLYGCLRLSSKYGVDAIRTNALKHLTSMFHTSFDEWDDERSVEDLDNEYPQYLVCCLQLGYEVDAAWTLPCMYYTLATYFDVLKLSQFHGVRWRGIEGKIAEAHQGAVMAGAEEQMRECWNVVLDVLADPSILEQCETSNACGAAILARLHAFQRDNREFCRDPLSMWQPSDWTALRVCPDCHSRLKRKVEAKQQAFWDRLPEIYGLPSWAELEARKKVALGDEDDEE